MEVLRTVVVIEHLTGLGKQGLHMFPYPLGPITDDTQTHLLFRNYAGLFDLLEGCAELLVVLDLMPTEHMDDALTIEEVETKALGIAPLPPPPRSLGSPAPAPLAGLPGTVGPGRHIGPINAQHEDRTAPAPGCHRGDTALDLLARRSHVHHGQTLSNLVGHSGHPFTPKVHPRQITKERLGGLIRHFSNQLHRGVLHIKLFTTRHQPQRVVEGGETHATSAAIKIGALQCDRPHHGLDRAPNVLLYLKQPRTLRTVGLRALAFTFVGLRALAFTFVGLLDNRLGDAPSELLA